MKLLPTSFRLSRKLLIILAGVTVLTGASGAAAIFVGREALLGPPAEEISGVACTLADPTRVRAWAQRRHAAIVGGRSGLCVGHVDIVARRPG